MTMNKIFPLKVHILVTFIWMLVALYLGFIYAPQEATMGEVYRIFFVHVPCAETSFVAFFMIFLGSVAYLWKRHDRADDFAHGAAEIGFIYCTGMIVTGPLWAKPTWGIWWTWDPRLTLTFVLWMLYVAYLMLRSYVISPGRSATLAAVMGIIGFVDVPIDYMAIRWWRTQHPQPVFFGAENSGVDPRIGLALLVAWGAFLCLFAYLMRQYMRLAALRREVTLLRQHAGALLEA